MRMTSLPLAVLLAIIAASTPSFAGSGDIETIRAQCKQKLTMPPGGCDCIAEKAGALGDAQQAFLAATLEDNEAEAARLRGNLTIAELTEAGMFFAQAPAACAQGG
jgi:hypothetical protein